MLWVPFQNTTVKQMPHQYFGFPMHVKAMFTMSYSLNKGLSWWLSGKESACQCRRCVGGEDTLEKEMATYSNVLAWKIPQTEEPGGLQSTGSQKSQTPLSA